MNPGDDELGGTSGLAASTPVELDEHLDDDRDDDLVLPWWRNPLTIGALVIGVLTLVGALGFVIGNNLAIDDPNDVDIGFLQDMRVHHEQAVEMSFLYLNNSGTDPSLRTVASSIMLEQQLEVGRMIQLLRGFGESEVNESDVAMTWMGAPMPLDEMPGLATDDELDRLRNASGIEADRIFVELMIAHHRAGIQMAEHEKEHGAVAEVTRMATQIIAGQRAEIGEMKSLLERAESAA